MRKRPARHNVKNCLLFVLLSLVMIGSIIPSSVFAEEGALPSGTVINITYTDSHGNSEPKLFDGYALKHISEKDFACDADGVEVASVVWEKSTDGQIWEDCAEEELVDGKYYYCLYVTFESSMAFPFTTKFTCSGMSGVKAVTATPQDKEARLIMNPVGSIYPEAKIDDIYYEKLTDALTDAEEGDTVVVIAEQYLNSVYSEEGRCENIVYIDKDITIHNSITLDLNNKSVYLNSGNTLTIDLSDQVDGSSSEVPENGTNADDHAFTIVNTADGEKNGGLCIQGTLEVCSGSQLNYSGLEPQKIGGIMTDSGNIVLKKDSLAVVPKSLQDADTIRKYSERYNSLLAADDGAYASFDDPADTDCKDRKLYICVNRDPVNVNPVWARVVDRIDVVYSGDAFVLAANRNLHVLSSGDFYVSGTDALSVQTVGWQKETASGDDYSWVMENQEGDSPVQIVNGSKYRLAVILSENDAPVYYRNFKEEAFNREIYDEDKCSLTTGTEEGNSEHDQSGADQSEDTQSEKGRSGIGQSETGFRILNYQSETEECTPVLYGYFDLQDPSDIDPDEGSCDITSQPTDQKCKIGQQVTFSVTAENAVSYQWQYSKNGTAWYNSTSTGAKTDTLLIIVKKSNCRNMYRCKITGLNHEVIYSESAAFDLIAGAKITSQPASAAAVCGESVTYTVTAENAVSYQWYYSKDNGTKWYKSSLSGSDTAAVHMTVTAKNADNLYRCKITGTDGNTIKSTAAGIILIAAQPEDSTAAVGTTGTFAVRADSGNPIDTYKWYYSKDSGKTWYASSATGFNTDILSVKVSKSNCKNLYRCKVTSSAGLTGWTSAVGFQLYYSKI